jgi:hypothetical protein
MLEIQGVMLFDFMGFFILLIISVLRFSIVNTQTISELVYIVIGCV